MIPLAVKRMMNVELASARSMYGDSLISQWDANLSSEFSMLPSPSWPCSHFFVQVFGLLRSVSHSFLSGGPSGVSWLSSFFVWGYTGLLSGFTSVTVTFFTLYCFRDGEIAAKYVI